MHLVEQLEASPDNAWDLLKFFKDIGGNIHQILETRLQSIKCIKWFITLFVRFVKYNQNNEAVYAEPVFRSSSFACTNDSQIEDQIAEAYRHLHNGFQTNF